MSDFESVFSNQGPTEDKPAETPQVEATEPTGEASAPPAPQQEDPIETHRKGLETAVVSERRRRQEAEARAQALEARIQEFSRQQQPQQQTEGPPDPTQFENNPQEYWRLLARYEARQELQQTMKAAQERHQAEQQQQAHQAALQRVGEMVSKGQMKYRDFDAVINAGLGPFLNPGMRDALADSDVGEEVSYWLAKNPAEAARISALPDRQMVREVTRLEAKLAKPAAQELPQTLTQVRDARGQFKPADDIPSLEAIFARSK